ncbi:hypothetical protein IJ541_06665 [bacterium]|nr:hypothetical protein [bacterium]
MKELNESMIKEIKSIYSGRLKSTNPISKAPDIKFVKNGCSSRRKSFFNGVIDKLNIVVADK